MQLGSMNQATEEVTLPYLLRSRLSLPVQHRMAQHKQQLKVFMKYALACPGFQKTAPVNVRNPTNVTMWCQQFVWNELELRAAVYVIGGGISKL